MRQGQQHRRGRGRNNANNNHPGNRNKGQNPLTRSFESNGPDVKVRGTPAHIAEKYMQLARDAQSSGDHVLAENYLQHAEHYNRIILAYREQQMQQSGEMINGNGRSHHQNQPRAEFQEADEGNSEPGNAGEEAEGSDQPTFVRHMGEQMRDAQPSFDENGPQHQSRNEGQPRFRDRHMRGDRGDRGERHERQGGYDRGEAQSGDRFERNRDRDRDRGYRYQSDQPGEGREARQQREPREPREMREPRRDNGTAASSVEGNGSAEAPAPNRSEGSPRRRERFGLSADQPEFLRRPVRRPRRDPEQDFAQDAPQAAPSSDETTGE